MTGSDNNWQDVGRNGRSFLLRCWQEGEPQENPDAANLWRFALVPIDAPSQARGFACLEELCACLSAELVAVADAPL